MTLRLLQFSDVHLDSNLSGSELRLDPSQRETRARELRESFRRALELGRDEGVDLVLIAGDLWDDEAVSADTVAFVGDALAAIAPIPVFIAPGNHDYYAAGSAYDPAFLECRGLKPWPKNVCIFSEGRFETVEVPGLPGVTVTGRAFRANVATTERLLAARIHRPKAELALGMFHGSRLGYEMGKKLVTAPFNDPELLAQGFAYTAVGHYHRRSELVAANGRVRAAYAGSLCGRTLAETGAHGALIVAVDGGGVIEEGSQFVELDPRRIVRVDLDVTGCGHGDAAVEAVRKAVAAAGARPQDQIVVRVTGRYPRGLEPPRDEQVLGGAYFHTRIVWDVVPDYDFESLLAGEARTVEARFARDLTGRIARAESDHAKAVLSEALMMGLDALTLGRVLTRGERFREEAEG